MNLREEFAQKIISKIEEHGDFITMDDGFVHYYPENSRGSLCEESLRVIADELERRNKTWNENIQEYFSKQEEPE